MHLEGHPCACAFCSGPRQTISTTMRDITIALLSEINGFIWFFLSLPPLSCFSWVAGPEETKNRAGRSPPPDSRPVQRRTVSQESRLLVKPNRCDFEPLPAVRERNETLSIATMRVSNPA